MELDIARHAPWQPLIQTDSFLEKMRIAIGLWFRELYILSKEHVRVKGYVRLTPSPSAQEAVNSVKQLGSTWARFVSCADGARVCYSLMSYKVQKLFHQ